MFQTIRKIKLIHGKTAGASSIRGRQAPLTWSWLMCQAANIRVAGLWHPQTRVPRGNRMCTAQGHGHTRTGAAPLPTGTHQTRHCQQPGVTISPPSSACRKVNADRNKTTKITSPECARNGSKNGVTFCLLPLEPALAKPGHGAAPAATWPPLLATLARTLLVTLPQPHFTLKAPNIRVAGAAETQVGADTQTKSKGKNPAPSAHNLFPPLFAALGKNQ